MAQINPWDNRHFVVWGLGKTGVATARYLLSCGARVLVVERGASEAHEASQVQLKGADFLWSGAEPSVEWLRALQTEAVVLSPGVPYDLPALCQLREAGIPTVASMQWAADQLRQSRKIPMVAVTGTAGKSTTVSLIDAMLRASGLCTFLGGNLGTPLASLLDRHEGIERLVLECSSFQLEAAPDLDADIAVLTNISSNHLDRHQTMERYAACKGQLFRRMRPESWALRRAEDAWSERVVADSPARALYFAPHKELAQGSFRQGSELVVRLPDAAEERYALAGFRLCGAHNIENAMVSALAARLAGASPAGVQAALDGFRALPHRLEEVGEPGAVRYFNDSKSTTPQSTAKAIAAFDPEREPIRLLLGGRSKGSDFRELLPALSRGVAGLYLFGEAASELHESLAPDLPQGLPIHLSEGLQEALHEAHGDAKPGEIILLSPACASFDQFRNFEARGDQFKRWVEALRAEEAQGHV